jgi:hypothetical protein
MVKKYSQKQQLQQIWAIALIGKCFFGADLLNPKIGLNL